MEKTKRKEQPSDDDNGFADMGGYMAAKIAKLEEQYRQQASKNPGLQKSKLFEGISIFVNGYTKPNPEELKTIMMEHGGVYHTYQRSWTTYVVASNLPDVKIRALGKEKVIRPDWIVDCLKENRLLDYSNYLLYTNQKTSQPSLHRFSEKKQEKKEETEQKPVSGGVKESQLDILHLKLNNKTITDPKPGSSKSRPSVSPEPGANPKEESLAKEKSPSDPHEPFRKSTKNATDPEFLQEFFKKSRLHHIATLGANFKQYVTDLREKHSGGFPARAKLMKTVKHSDIVEKTAIMHIDMDCFFVSVGLRTRPHLRGLPVAVTHSEGGQMPFRVGSNRELEAELYQKRVQDRFDQHAEDEMPEKLERNLQVFRDEKGSLAEIASCSYEARKMGVHNGMFMGAALKLCPDLKTIPYDFEEYQKVARTLYDTIAQYTLDIEAVSCDEMFVDLSELLITTKLDIMEVITSIRNEIKEKTGCPCSAGIGKNKLQARLATKVAKPDGQYLMQNVQDHINDLPITELPGVGYSTSFKLEKLNMKTCADLQKLTLGVLQIEFGKKFGETLYQFCRGIDNRPLQYEHVRQSISVDVNYGIRFKKHSEVEFFLRQLSEELHKRMVEIKHVGKKLTLKILIRAKNAPVETAKFLGTGLCDAVSRTVSLHPATNDTQIMFDQIIKMYHAMDLPPEELRGIGVGMYKLENLRGNKANPIIEMFKKAPAKKVVEETEENIVRNLERFDNTKVIPKPTPVVRTPPKKSNRGRPRKIQTPTKASKTITVFFKKPDTETDQSNQDPFELDPNFLSALPEELREEVLRDQQLLLQREKMRTATAVTRIDSNKSTSSSTISDTIIESETKPTHQTEPKPTPALFNLFLQKDFASVMSDWIQMMQTPMEEDGQLLVDHAIELLQEKRLPELHVGLKFLHRKLSPLSCEWHKMFEKLVDEVQSAMLVRYKATLAIEKITCKKCH